MSAHLSRLLVGKRLRSGARRRVSLFSGSPVERLEDRALLTATLYVDFGDLFTGGVLNTTTGELNSHTVDGVNINGPQLRDSSKSAYPAGTSLEMTAFNTIYGADAASFRAAIMGLAERSYAPYDITVVELTASYQLVNGHSVRAAQNLDDVSKTLAANNSDSKHNDSYVFVVQGLIGGTTDDSTTNPTRFPSNGYGGIANGLDIGSTNQHEGTALVLLRDTDYSQSFLGNQVSHESGHLFGFTHVYRQDTGNPPPASLGPAGPDLDLLNRSELMSYLAYNGYDFFSRVPVMDGDGNEDPNTLTNTPTPYDHLKADPEVGASGIEYVSGTGAHDIITIVKTTATTGTATIQPYSDTSYTSAIDFPGPTGTSYSFVIDLTKTLVVDAGPGNDKIIIDGDLGTTVIVQAGSGTDSLEVDGKNQSDGTYSPGTNNEDGLDGNSDLRGTLTIGSTVIQVQEFEAGSTVTVENLTSFDYVTPLDPLLQGNDVLQVNRPLPLTNSISGTTSGIPVFPFVFAFIQNFTIDTAFNDHGSPDDTVSISSAGLVAASLTNFTVDTGRGNDILAVNESDFRLPVPGGSFLYRAGLGNDGGPVSNQRSIDSLDRLIVNADVDFLLKPVGTAWTDGTFGSALLSAADAGSGDAALATRGSINLEGVEAALLTGGAGNNRMDASTFLGPVVLDGAGGNNTLIGSLGNSWLMAGDGNNTLVDPIDLTGALQLFNPTYNVVAGGIATNVMIAGNGTNTFQAGSASTTMIGGSGVNTFTIENPLGGLQTPVGGYRVIGGGNAETTLNLLGGGGAGFYTTATLGPVPQGATNFQIWSPNLLALVTPSLLRSLKFDLEISTRTPFNGTYYGQTQSVLVAGVPNVNNTIAASLFQALAGPGASGALGFGPGTTPDLTHMALELGGVPVVAFDLANQGGRAGINASGQVIPAPVPFAPFVADEPVVLGVASAIAPAAANLTLPGSASTASGSASSNDSGKKLAAAPVQAEPVKHRPRVVIAKARQTVAKKADSHTGTRAQKHKAAHKAVPSGPVHAVKRVRSAAAAKAAKLKNR